MFLVSHLHKKKFMIKLVVIYWINLLRGVIFVFLLLVKQDLEKLIGKLNCVFSIFSNLIFSILGQNIDLGLLPRFCQNFFDKVSEELVQQNVVIEVLFYELYLEKVIYILLIIYF